MTPHPLDKNLFMKDALDLQPAFERVAEFGAYSISLLSKEFRLALLEEVGSYTYQPEEEFVGSGESNVHQQMSTRESFPAGSRYLQLRDAFQAPIDRPLAALQVYPFQDHLQFNSLSLQRYDPGSIGITPHRDSLRYINLICPFVIGGLGRFFVCTDRAGNDSIEIDAPPGRLILMRAPGFMGSQARPFHYLTDITDRGYGFGLRQRRIADG